MQNARCVRVLAWVRPKLSGGFGHDIPVARYGCSVHALTDQAVRLLIGLSERRVCMLAHVCRDTLQRYERGEEIATPAKLARLRAVYAWLHLGVLQSAQAKADRDDVYDTDDHPTLPPPAMSSVRAA
jgi:hypothetical protein